MPFSCGIGAHALREEGFFVSINPITRVMRNPKGGRLWHFSTVQSAYCRRSSSLSVPVSVSKTQVPNRDLKAMVESYKTRDPQSREAQHRASARDELNALVKDMAAKVSIDKPKVKSKSKKGPEL